MGLMFYIVGNRYQVKDFRQKRHVTALFKNKHLGVGTSLIKKVMSPKWWVLVIVQEADAGEGEVELWEPSAVCQPHHILVQGGLQSVLAPKGQGCQPRGMSGQPSPWLPYIPVMLAIPWPVLPRLPSAEMLLLLGQRWTAPICVLAAHLSPPPVSKFTETWLYQKDPWLDSFSSLPNRHWGFSSWPHLILITSQRHRLLTPSRCGWGLPCVEDSQPFTP